jgi:long-chain fatty acid transport protein
MRRSAYVSRALWLLCALAPCWPENLARAGGLTLLDRGARPLSRGGAFVAGADDLNALWYNPAGLRDAKNQVFTDATLTLLFASYRRYYDDGTQSAKADAKPTPLPIPTLGVSHNFGLKDVTFGAGVLAPNTVLLNWPRSVRQAGIDAPSPTRYSLLGLKGSILANTALGLAYHGIKNLSIGADVQLALGRFKADVALSSCGDGITCTFPEDPEYDAYTTLDVLPAWGVTGVFGITYIMGPLRVGASLMLPYELKGTAKLTTRLPESPVFENASVQGDKAEFGMKYPLIVRVGSELRPVPALRMEAAFVWEQWSAQKSIDVTPDNVRMINVLGIGDYDVGPIKIPRSMNDVWSIRAGYELFVPPQWLGGGFRQLDFALRGGLAYETSAFSNRTLTPLTLDSDKFLISGGFSLNLTSRLRFDTAIGYYRMADPKVRNSELVRPAAIRPASQADSFTLGNGSYKMEAFFLGGGFSYRL